MNAPASPPLTDYERYLLRYSAWSLARAGREPFDDRISRSLFGAGIADKFLSAGLIEPWGTTRLGDPAYRLTAAAAGAAS